SANRCRAAFPTPGRPGRRAARDYDRRAVATRDIDTSSAGVLARLPSTGLVVGAIASVQFGAAIAATLFAQVGAGGAALLRLMWASIVLLALWRPRLRGRTHGELGLACAFGV